VVDPIKRLAPVLIVRKVKEHADGRITPAENVKGKKEIGDVE
jgi:hypothetical protein